MQITTGAGSAAISASNESHLRARAKQRPARAQQHEQPVPKRSVIGVGSGANYTLYDPASDHIEFLSVASRSRPLSKGQGFLR